VLIERDLSSLHVRPILRDEVDRWNSLMFSHHYLGFRTLPGNSLKYVAILDEEWVALLGWGSAALKSSPRDTWIGWSSEQRMRRLKYVVNNSRFLVLPGIKIRNLASKTLSLNVKRLSGDWRRIYGHSLLLAETFVDQSLFAGTCYRAAGWRVLGMTRGFRRNGTRYFFHGNPKTVCVVPLCRNAPGMLSAPFFCPDVNKKEIFMLDLNKASIDEQGGLLDQLAKVTDPRMRRGVRHTQISILAIAVCAVLSGARSFLAIGEWACDLSQDILERFKSRWSDDKRRYIPPSEPTIRRTLKTIDAGEVDRIIGNWLAGHCAGEAIALDGKTVRGSKGSTGKGVHLVSALLHNEGVVIAQKAVDGKSNEITAVKPLLDSTDIRGKVITADAMHAQVEHANYLKEEKGADYVFTVKGNQATLLKDIQDLGDRDFSPSV
jgi:hypothetical protein